ncbi:MAG: hypothetical protein GX192_08515, partial [Clostridiales bacterium]|nr:hypothetical protein [Clostridiales bacterium]
MAKATTYRINRLAKDFNIKSKDILDLLKDYGFENKTHMAILEPEDFNLFIELITGANQISNIDGYVKGEIKIPRLVPKKTEPQPSHEKSSTATTATTQETKATEPAAKDTTDKEIIDKAPATDSTPAAMQQSQKEDAKLSSHKEEKPHSESRQQTQVETPAQTQAQVKTQTQQTQKQTAASAATIATTSAAASTQHTGQQAQ